MDIAKAETLLAWMRANGVVRARVDDVELELAPDERDESVPTQREPVGAFETLVRSEAAASLDEDTRRLGTMLYGSPEDDPDLYDGKNVPGFEELTKSRGVL